MAKKTFENKSEQLLSKFISTSIAEEEAPAAVEQVTTLKSAKVEKKGASFSLSVEVLEALREKSFTARIPKSDIVEKALIEYLNK